MSPNFCADCGAPIVAISRFCGNYGKPIVSQQTNPPLPATPDPVIISPTPPVIPISVFTPPSAPITPPFVQTPPQAEKPLSMIEGLCRKKNFLQMDGVWLLITDRRLGIIILSTDIVKRMASQTYEQARANGAGKLGAMFTDWVEYAKKHYSTIPIDEALHEHPDNIAYGLNQIRGFKIKRGRVTRHVKSSGFNRGGDIRANGEIIIDTVSGSIKLEVVA